jgi:two-component sensor histidine kinase
LRSVVESAVEAHGSRERQFEIEGPDVELTPRQALSTALAVHELATNAAKYGALSVDGGRVSIKWTREGRDAAGGRAFAFTWTERGGPPVVVPDRKGFGSRLITRVFPADFRGEVRIEYRPGGVVCSMLAPIDSIEIKADASAARAAGEREAQ